MDLGNYFIDVFMQVFLCDITLCFHFLLGLDCRLNSSCSDYSSLNEEALNLC
uniref:Uncharacterized protein n=1 Tax=Rhizophora mucronata TaxID=61149 RepID=A0A2P2P4J6_RHIMU